MWRKVSKMVLAVIGIIGCNSAMAYDIVSNGIYYTLQTSDMTLCVVYGDEPYKGQIVIPNTVEYNTRTLEVTAIGKKAFYNCGELTDITLPVGLKTIAEEAFYGCYNLNQVQLPNGITTIKERAFQGCENVATLNIPSSVTSIEKFAFDMIGLKEIVIEDSDTEIKVGHSPFGKETGSFYGTFAETAYIGRNLNYELGDWERYPFGCNNSLKAVTIGEKVTKLSAYYFYGATALRTVTVINRNPFECYDNVFSSATYIDGKLIVPQGTTEIYKQTKCWSNFFVIEEDESMNTGIRQIGTSKDYDIYTISGTKTDTPNKGVNIIKSKDRRNKKVLVR